GTALLSRNDMLTAEIKVNGERVAVLEIQNDGRGTRAVGHYDVALYTDRGPRDRKARVEGWDRSRPAHELVRVALEAVAGRRQIDRETALRCAALVCEHCANGSESGPSRDFPDLLVH